MISAHNELRGLLAELKAAGVQLTMEDPQPNAPAASAPPAPPSAGFTQADVDRRVAQALQEQTTRIEKELGATPVEAARIVREAQERDRAQMAETDRLKLESAEAKTAAEKAKAEAAAVLHTASVKVALAGKGVPTANVADLLPLVNVPVGSDDATIEAAIDGLKTKFPGLFEATAPGVPHQQLPKPPAQLPADDAMERGRERARQRMATANSYSFVKAS